MNIEEGDLWGEVLVWRADAPGIERDVTARRVIGGYELTLSETTVIDGCTKIVEELRVVETSLGGAWQRAKLIEWGASERGAKQAGGDKEREAAVLVGRMANEFDDAGEGGIGSLLRQAASNIAGVADRRKRRIAREAERNSGDAKPGGP